MHRCGQLHHNQFEDSVLQLQRDQNSLPVCVLISCDKHYQMNAEINVIQNLDEISFSL